MKTKIKKNTQINIKNRIELILKTLNNDLYEREETINLAFLTAMAGESIFLLGPPGVAKSLISRRIKEVFKNGKSFEYLMNRFSSPDEIFGPIDIKKMKDEGKYERKVNNYLPSADIVFLDEIWKASSSIQNALLTVINEKTFRNGEQEINVPMKVLISASNELPAKGEGLDALWDRFIVRYFVSNIKNKEKFNTYITNNASDKFEIENSLKISNDEFIDFQKNIEDVKLSLESINVINVVRSYIERDNKKKHKTDPIYISDRRWKKILRILKTSAFLNNRNEVDLMDCFLISHTIWDEEIHIEYAQNIVIDAIEKHAYSLKYDLTLYSKEIKSLDKDIEKQLTTYVDYERIDERIVKDWTNRINKVIKEIDVSLREINDYINNEMHKINNNLFIPDSLIKIAEKGIGTTKNGLMEKRVEINNLKEKYGRK